MAFLQYGSYAFEDNQTYFQINRRAIVGPTGRRNFVHHQWVINGRVTGADSDAIAGKIAALESSMLDGYDLTFSLGGHSLPSSACTEGTHIRHFSWLTGTDNVRGSGAECILRRTFTLIIDGLMQVDSDTNIIGWHESVSGIGSGTPNIVPVGSLWGEVLPQQTQAWTPWHIIQSGYAIGLTRLPDAATPIWANGSGGNVFWVPNGFRITPETPSHWGINMNTHFKISWSYRYWSRVPLVGSPSFWV